MSEYKLSHLKELEAESIHIIREVVAEFENPVMLYSIGKDSSVMVRLAEKAFYPGKVPFPLMHIDSKWKFKEMIEFRDKYARENNWDLIVESNMKGFQEGVGPFTHGSKVHTDLMKTQALLQALSKYKFDAAFGGARRDEEKSRAKERIYSFRDKFHQCILKTSVLNYGIYTMPGFIKANRSGYSRCLIGRNWISGNTSAWKIFLSYLCILPKNVPSSKSTVT